MGKMVLLFASAGTCLMLTMVGDGGSCRTKEKAVPDPPANMTKHLANGVWGGDHIRAEVTDSGAEIEFDCGHGAIVQAIVTDSAGRFDLPGKYVTEFGGPTRKDRRSNNGRTVRYLGEVNSEALTLTISDVETKESLGTFTLTHGSEGRLRKCR